MEIKFQQLLFTAQKRTKRCNLEIEAILAIRSIILGFVLFCWKPSKKFLLTFERKKKPDFRQYYLFKNA